MTTGSQLPQWSVIEQILEGLDNAAAKRLHDDLFEIRWYADGDPDMAASDLADLRLRLEEEYATTKATSDALRTRIPAWTKESCQLLKEQTEDFFDKARKEIHADLHKRVHYGAQFSESYYAVKNGVVSYWDKWQLESAVKDFFKSRLDDDDAYARLDDLDKRIVAASDELKNLKQSIYKASDKEQTEVHKKEFLKTETANLNARKKDLDAERKALIDAGLKRYDALSKEGFFDANVEQRRGILCRFDQTLHQKFIEKDWIIHKDNRGADYKREGILAEVCDQHLGATVQQLFREKMIAEQQSVFRSFWHKALDEEGISSEKFNIDMAISDHEQLSPSVPALALLAGMAVGSPIVATGILAAGWHTLPWALSHLFLPFGLLMLPVTAIAVWKGKDLILDDLVRKANLYVEQLRQAQLRGADTTWLMSSEIVAQSLIDNYVSVIVRQQIGVQSVRQLQNIISAIEDVRQALQADSYAGRPDFLDLARTALERREHYAAAALATSAYEAVIMEWLARAELPQPSSFDYLRHSLELLEKSPHVPKNVVERMRKLRRQRHLWAHGMRDLVGLDSEKQRQRIASFLSVLDDIRPH